jgi:hypothetical protein
MLFIIDSSAFWREAWIGLQRPMGAAAGAGAIALVAVGVIRALTWRRDCADIAGLLKQCCDAVETDRAQEL